MNWYCVGLEEVPAQTKEFLPVMKSIVRCSSIRPLGILVPSIAPLWCIRKAIQTGKMICPQRWQQKPNLPVCPMHSPLGLGLPQRLFCSKCSRLSFWPQQGMFCSVLQGHFCPPLFTVTKTSRRVSWPKPLAWRSKVEFLLWSRSYQNNIRIFIIPHDTALYNLLPSDPIDTLSFSL